MAESRGRGVKAVQLELTVYSGCIMWAGRVVDPPQGREKVLIDLHWNFSNETVGKKSDMVTRTRRSHREENYGVFSVSAKSTYTSHSSNTPLAVAN